ncbi:MAG: hypothetical protein MJE12_08830 [Alphaproteobacteria bacterium]|nr:hypothetical protein [Alphaproteobacteria bacterium]
MCAIQAERLTRVKRQGVYLTDDADTVTRCVRYCLEDAGVGYGDLSNVAICTPWQVVAPEASDLSRLIGGALDAKTPIVTVPHHYAHAEYAVHYAPMEPGLVLIVDGSGSYEEDRAKLTVQEAVDPDARLFVAPRGKETVSGYYFDGEQFRLVYRFAHPSGPEAAPAAGILNIRLLQSIGHLWRWASWYCCGGGNDAGKVMGLAAHGEVAAHADLDFAETRSDGFLSIRFDLLNKTFKSPNLNGIEISGNQHYADLAAAVQDRTNRMLTDLLGLMKGEHPAEALYYSGGVALNVVANEVITRSKLFRSVHMNGSCEDNGTAIGAALAAHMHVTGERVPEPVTDYYGRTYRDSEIESALDSARCAYRRLPDSEVAGTSARLLAEGGVIGWFQGGSEFGPRALGNRSIIANPTDPHIKYVLDLIVKRRERYRPYAPAVLAERSREFFDIDGMSPVMLREGAVHNPARLPAITHVDKSARVQTVTREENPRYYDLIKRFGDLTGIPVVLNTSYNLAGEPIVESPEDAVRSFMKSGLRNLVIGNYLVDRPRTA